MACPPPDQALYNRGPPVRRPDDAVSPAIQSASLVNAVNSTGTPSDLVAPVDLLPQLPFKIDLDAMTASAGKPVGGVLMRDAAAEKQKQQTVKHAKKSNKSNDGSGKRRGLRHAV